MTRRNPVVTLLLCGGVLMGASTALADGEDGLAFLLQNLFGVVVLDNPNHAAHFSDQGELGVLNQSFVAAVAPQLATVPVGSPGGGLTFAYDPESGAFARSSKSFGSMFSERALTVGRSRWNVGISAQSAKYDSLGPLDLDGGDILFQLRHQDVPPLGVAGDPEVEEDLIGAETAIELSTETTTLFFTYGISDKLDVSFVLPYVTTDLSAAATLRIENLVPSTREDPTIHQFTPGLPNLEVIDRSTAIVRRSGSASGIGDVLVRMKYRFRDMPGGGMAAGLDLRLATGREEDLLGTGGTSTKLFLIGSRECGDFGPHFNVGYTFSQAGGDVIETLPDEMSVNVGALWAVTPRVTLSGDLLGRRLLDSPVLVTTLSDFDLTGDGEVLRPDIEADTADLSLLLASLGVRANPTRNLLVSLNVLFSLADDGLVDKGLIPVVALDYSF
jgi:Putative MetA-pathway of phenol degradation